MSLLKSLLTACAASAAAPRNSDYTSLSWERPKAQQRGGITYFPRTILSSPGNPLAYSADARKVGMRVRFRSGTTYKVGPAGNLIRA